MRVWTWDEEDGSPGPECGAAGCAFGHACNVPSFKRDGLAMTGRGPVFNNKQGFWAAQDFFDLERFEADYLFDGYSYDDKSGNRQFAEQITPARVARRIEYMLEHGSIGERTT